MTTDLAQAGEGGQDVHLGLGQALLGHGLHDLVAAPAELGQRLRREYNAWLAEYAAKHGDIAVFDQFGTEQWLETGRLRQDDV